jgi:ribosomal protein L39E
VLMRSLGSVFSFARCRHRSSLGCRVWDHSLVRSFWSLPAANDSGKRVTTEGCEEKTRLSKESSTNRPSPVYVVRRSTELATSARGRKVKGTPGPRRHWRIGELTSCG